jgi:hypothetical protein
LRAKHSPQRAKRDDVLLWLFALTPVAAWIAAQELSFLATRSICAGGHRWVLYVVMGPALAAAVAAGVASWVKLRVFARNESANAIQARRRFMALGGVLLAAICAISIVALMIAASIHRLCD